jgi:hypothetical protein
MVRTYIRHYTGRPGPGDMFVTPWHATSPGYVVDQAEALIDGTVIAPLNSRMR